MNLQTGCRFLYHCGTVDGGNEGRRCHSVYTTTVRLTYRSRFILSRLLT